MSGGPCLGNSGTPRIRRPRRRNNRPSFLGSRISFPSATVAVCQVWPPLLHRPTQDLLLRPEAPLLVRSTIEEEGTNNQRTRLDAYQVPLSTYLRRSWLVVGRVVGAFWLDGGVDAARFALFGRCRSFRRRLAGGGVRPPGAGAGGAGAGGGGGVPPGGGGGGGGGASSVG